MYSLIHHSNQLLVYCISSICNWWYQGELGFCCRDAEPCINVYGRVWLYTKFVSSQTNHPNSTYSLNLLPGAPSQPNFFHFHAVFDLIPVWEILDPPLLLDLFQCGNQFPTHGERSNTSILNRKNNYFGTNYLPFSAAFAGPEGIWSYDIKNTAYMVVVAWSVPFDDNLYEEKFNVKVTTRGRKLEYVVAKS